MLVWPALECIVRIDNVSFTRGRRVSKRIILHYAFQEEDQVPCKISGSAHSLPNIYICRYGRTDNHQIFKKG